MCSIFRYLRRTPALAWRVCLEGSDWTAAVWKPYWRRRSGHPYQMDFQGKSTDAIIAAKPNAVQIKEIALRSAHLSTSKWLPGSALPSPSRWYLRRASAAAGRTDPAFHRTRCQPPRDWPGSSAPSPWQRKGANLRYENTLRSFVNADDYL